MQFVRLALRSKKPRATAIVVLGTESEDHWQTITRPEVDRKPRIGPGPHRRGGWMVDSQAASRPPSLADVVQRYQHYLARERQVLHGVFTVKA